MTPGHISTASPACCPTSVWSWLPIRSAWPSRRRQRHRIQTDVGPTLVGEIEIRPDQFQAFVAGQSLDLTRREFELLHLLCESDGRVLERDAIYQRVWGYAMAHGDRSVDVFIRKVRQKLEKKSPGWAYIHTHFGIGYRFAAESLVPEGKPSEAPEAASKADADDGLEFNPLPDSKPLHIGLFTVCNQGVHIS